MVAVCIGTAIRTGIMKVKVTEIKMKLIYIKSIQSNASPTENRHLYKMNFRKNLILGIFTTHDAKFYWSDKDGNKHEPLVVK